MDADCNEVERLTFVDTRAYLENQLGTERWVTLYQFDDYGASGREDLRWLGH